MTPEEKNVRAHEDVIFISKAQLEHTQKGGEIKQAENTLPAPGQGKGIACGPPKWEMNGTC